MKKHILTTVGLLCISTLGFSQSNEKPADALMGKVDKEVISTPAEKPQAQPMLIEQKESATSGNAADRNVPTAKKSAAVENKPRKED